MSLGVSQVLRWIDELNGKTGLEETVAGIRYEIRQLKRQPDSVLNRRAIAKLYTALDQEQFVPDYMCLVIDKEKDMHVACKGFVINGIRYVRLVGTNGGVKNQTIVFVSERLAPELRRRIDNGRRQGVKFVPAKLEAYRALTCSGSTSVSMPNGILVVNDCETEFTEDIISLSDEDSDEPKMEIIRNAKIRLNESDGYGLMLPSLAKRWSEELGLDFVTSGVNTRFAWEKGMVFCFDFLEFAEKVAGKRVVKDAWGNEVDITSVELILTTSMLKLWDSYESCEHYLSCCQENRYEFGITKHCPVELESERNLNYQFIQSYELTDAQIDELIQPTVDEIKDVLSGDYRKAILFLAGTHLTEKNALSTSSILAKALMVNPAIHDDPFVKSGIFKLIKNRIAEAKVGVIRVRGNYSVVSGDPYSLCQHIFGLEVTGILKAGQIYNGFWVDAGVDQVACFRAPMTCHNNIRKMNVFCSEEAGFWYRHMKACTIFNSWDSAAHALNGMDKDGDMVLLTDNRVLVDNIRPLPTIMCIQRNATKIDVAEEDLIQANIDSFGDDIGKTTNWITSMFDVQARFKKGSREYETLDYRIKCGQLFQQNAIDKAKGIVAKPMPRYWYDSASASAGHKSRNFNLRILADKKPYFMRYIYSKLMSQYNEYIKNTETKCIREFRLSVDDLLQKPRCELTDQEKGFIRHYRSRVPVGMNSCVMNRICKRIESEFDGYLLMKCSSDDFCYQILKGDECYTKTQINSIGKLYDRYNKKLKEYMQMSNNSYIDPDERTCQRGIMRSAFLYDCQKVCSNNTQLCNILVDLCYSKESTKQFAWDMCGEEIIENLFRNGQGVARYPEFDEAGDILYRGKRFSMKELEVL